ncbi:MAG: cupredoxin domain-containing protein [Actinobacteria bacterium]|nr:cupredoxin domain-containing protein [Actinomycetota bacterium]MCB9390416.1 cupredoxin domain-containing protein [Acidimicrobiia bacterium]
MKVRRIIAALAITSLALFGCSSDSDDKSDNPSSEGSTAPMTAEIVIADNAFDPADVTIAAGGTVTFKFDDGQIPHNVHATNGEFDDSGNRLRTTYEVTLDEPGTVEYTDLLYPDMKGTITVE